MSHSWNSILLAAYTSTYDAAGRLTNSSRQTYSNFGGVSDSDASTCTHDRIGQLTGVARNPGAPASEIYIYDPAGNRAVSGATSYTNVAATRVGASICVRVGDASHEGRGYRCAKGSL